MRRTPPLPCTSSFNGVILRLVGSFALVALQNREGKVFRWIGRRALLEAKTCQIGARFTMIYNSPFGEVPGACRILKVPPIPVRLPWAHAALLGA